MDVQGAAEFYRGRRTLVTGGAGFLGSHVVEMLVDWGARTTVIVRPTTDPAYLAAVRDRIEVVQADLFEARGLERLFDGQQIVLHLAAAKGGGIAHSMKHHGSLFRDNMRTTISVLEAARLSGVPRALMVSSACVYPRDSRVPTPESEGFRDAPEPTNAGYGWSKRMQEFMAAAYADEFGMDIGVVRPFNAYGPRDDFFRPTSHVIPDLIKRVEGGENPLVVWGSGEQTRSFLYATDFARGVGLAGAHPGMRGPLNLGSAEEVTIAELARMIIRASGRAVDIVFDRSRPDGQPRRACDPRAARAELGFIAHMPLAEGLERTIHWFREANCGQTARR